MADSNGENRTIPPIEGTVPSDLTSGQEDNQIKSDLDSNGDHNLCTRYEIDKIYDSNGGRRSKDSNGEINLCTKLESHESDSNGGSNTPKNELNPKKGQNPKSSSEYPSKFCKLPNLSAGSPSLRLAITNRERG